MAATKSDVAGVAFAVVVLGGIAVMTAPNGKGPGLVRAMFGGFANAIQSAVSPSTGRRPKG